MAENAAALRLVAEAIAGARHVTVPPPPVFDRSDGSYTIEDFFTLYESYAASLYGPKSRSWVLVLQNFLAGEPRQALSALGVTTTDYDDVKRLIISCCKASQGIPRSPQENFLQATRRPDESLQVFVLRLEALATAAFGAGEGVKAAVMPKLMLSLSPEVRRAVEAHLLTMNNPTLDAALPLAVALSISLTDHGSQLDTVRTIGVRAPPNPTPARAAEERARSFGQRQLRCYSCGSTGHLAAQCRATVPQRGSWRGRGGPASRGRGAYRGRGRGQGNPENNVCPYCGSFGHFMRDCREFQRTMGGGPSRQDSGN